MSVIFNGMTLLNPSEKARKYCAELHDGFRRTNDNRFIVNENGKKITLSKRQRAFRAGYLTSRKDNAKCFNAKKKK